MTDPKQPDAHRPDLTHLNGSDLHLSDETADTETNEAGEQTDEAPVGISIDGTRLTPQAGTADEAAGEDHTHPAGGAKQGQSDKAEGEV